MQVEFLGHAGMTVSGGNTTLLMDGWFSREGAFDAAWFQLPANHHLGERDWSHLDGVIVSHEHLDHLDARFLRSLPATVPLYVVSYGPPLFVQKLLRMVGRAPKVLAAGVEHQIGDLRLRAWTEESPMNQDSVWVFRHGRHSVVHTVDSRLTLAQMDEVLEYTGGSPDLLLVQCSGASWYPIVYENYTEAVKQTRGLLKREQKLSYALSAARRLQPHTLVCCAGPPAFLDPILRYANQDPSFPTPGEARRWLTEQDYRGRIETPLPGDRLDLISGELVEDRAMHDAFSWEAAPQYIEHYAVAMRPTIEAVYRRADALVVKDMNEAVERHFERMLSLSPFFNERINMAVCFDIEGEQAGHWLVKIGSQPGVRPWKDGDEYQYRYRFHSRWLKRILVDQLPWEDFFLSLRFSAHREPDVYNDHLLGLLKFNDAASLRAVEQYEKKTCEETIVVATADGTRYEIARYCPHAGADLEGAPIKGDTITCLNHHYVFDLQSGHCLTGNCTLRTRKLSS